MHCVWRPRCLRTHPSMDTEKADFMLSALNKVKKHSGPVCSISLQFEKGPPKGQEASQHLHAACSASCASLSFLCSYVLHPFLERAMPHLLLEAFLVVLTLKTGDTHMAQAQLHN